ncbi:acyl carrier protein [Nitrosopumilus sp.]|uniref:acyl carrier protein n=1 Tax=Nitrosopumilus sp. TaxID=2024843 RepID=UPI003D0DB735
MVNEQNIDKKIEKIANDVLQNKNVTLESSMEDIPEWDSLKHIQLIIAIEETFDITIDFSDTLDMTSMPAIKKKILKYLQ